MSRIPPPPPSRNQFPCNHGDRDVAGATLGSEVDGIISTEQSVSAMLRVISTKTLKDSGTFWTWEGKVNQMTIQFFLYVNIPSEIHGESQGTPAALAV